MNISRPLRLVMAPLVCSFTLAALESAPAAPVKKAPPAPAVVEAPPPPAKRPFFQKLNPFRKKDPPPAPAPPPVPAKNSKKSGTASKPAAKSLAEAPVRPVRPARSAADMAAAAAAAAANPLPPAVAPEEEKKPGFFSRLKARLDRDPEAVDRGEKPERPVDWKDFWVVTEDSTAFYEFGPSQASGPDRRLPRGQVVKLAQPGKGWAKVELEGGKQGYIGTDQMRQAAETDFAEPLRPATQLALGRPGSSSNLQPWSPAAPMPDLPDLPMEAGMENSLLLLPPLDYEGAELKRSSMRLPAAEPPTLKPGDALPLTLPDAPPSLEPAPPTPGPAPETEAEVKAAAGKEMEKSTDKKTETGTESETEKETEKETGTGTGTDSKPVEEPAKAPDSPAPANPAPSPPAVEPASPAPATEPAPAPETPAAPAES